MDALTQHPKYFNVKVERAKTYFPIIEKIFEEERLPVDFKYLALQESALIPDAVSSSNAVGFWQFKESTAHEVGLRVDNDVDERMNIASASRGAARYLKQCNHYFNNWMYALQSYQMGAGGVMRAVGNKDLGGRSIDVTSDTYWYVKKFLAHKVAFEEAVSGKGQVEVTRLKMLVERHGVK
ncbi:MAG: lytic transglycosylase domain-containing protein [Bacteroidota bacterium]